MKIKKTKHKCFFEVKTSVSDLRDLRIEGRKQVGYRRQDGHSTSSELASLVAHQKSAPVIV
jgi:hypothetical protein